MKDVGKRAMPCAIRHYMDRPTPGQTHACRTPGCWRQSDRKPRREGGTLPGRIRRGGSSERTRTSNLAVNTRHKAGNQGSCCLVTGTFGVLPSYLLLGSPTASPASFHQSGPAQQSSDAGDTPDCPPRCSCKPLHSSARFRTMALALAQARPAASSATGREWATLCVTIGVEPGRDL